MDGYWIEGHGACADRREALAVIASPAFNRNYDRVFFNGEEVGFCGSGCGLLWPDGECGPCYGAEASRSLARNMGRR
jgi:hypothetical protein